MYTRGVRVIISHGMMKKYSKYTSFYTCIFSTGFKYVKKYVEELWNMHCYQIYIYAQVGWLPICQVGVLYFAKLDGFQFPKLANLHFRHVRSHFNPVIFSIV